MRMLTLMEMGEIRKWEKDMQEPHYTPNTAQKKLAEELTTLLHGTEGFQSAVRATQAAAPGHNTELTPEVFRQMMQELPYVEYSQEAVVGKKYTELAAESGLVSSKGEGARLVEQGGAYLNNERVDNPQLRLESSHLIGGEFVLLGAGKKKKILIHISI